MKSDRVIWILGAAVVAVAVSIAAVGFLAVQVLLPPPRAFGTLGDVIVHVETDKAEFDAGEPVRIRGTLNNSGDLPVRLTFASSCTGGLLVVRNPSDLVIRAPSREEICAQVITVTTLAPGQTWITQAEWMQRTSLAPR